MNKIEKIKKIERPQVAVELNYNGFDADGNLIEHYYLDVRFEDIKEAEVGDTFVPETGNLQNYNIETARVILKNENDALIKVCYQEDIGYNYYDKCDIFHVVFD